MKLIWSRHPLSLVDYDPTGISEAIIIAAAFTAGAGIVDTIISASTQPKQPSLPATPSLDQAGETAQQSQTQQRQAQLAAGGQTSVAGPGGIVLGGDTSSATLVGSN